MHQQMPDLHLTIEDMIAENDKVVCRNVWRGTQFLPVPTTSALAPPSQDTTARRPATSRTSQHLK